MTLNSISLIDDLAFTAVVLSKNASTDECIFDHGLSSSVKRFFLSKIISRFFLNLIFFPKDSSVEKKIKLKPEVLRSNFGKHGRSPALSLELQKKKKRRFLMLPSKCE